MKRVITFMCVAALTFFVSNKVKADEPSLNGTNYYPIWLDADTEEEYEITNKIVQDLRVNWDAATNPDGDRALYIWESTYVSNAATGKGSLGQIGGFLDFNVSPAAGWSGLGFTKRTDSPVATLVDLTAITDEYHFHMAFKSSMNKAHNIQVFGSEKGAANFSIGTGMIENKPNITPNFKMNEWNVIDIPVSQLRTYGFTNRAAFTGNYFVVLSGAPANQIAIDAIYFYLPGTNAVNDVKMDKLHVKLTKRTVEVVNATAPIEVYNVTGALVKKSVQPVFGVDELAKGAYIIKSGNAVTKVIIK